MAVALMSLIAGLLALCSPETKDIPMPEDIQDFDPGTVYTWLFGGKSKEKAKTTLNTNMETATPLLTPPHIIIEDNDLKPNPKSMIQ